MNLALGFLLDYRYDLETGLRQISLGQHISATRKVLKARVNQHQVILGGGGAPAVTDSAYLTAPYGVSLPETVVMERSAHARLWVVLDTLLGRYHPTAKVMDAVVWDLIEQKTELEEYSHS